MNKGRSIGLAACLALMVFTGNKLHEMMAIRGWVPDAQVVRKTITGKHSERYRKRMVYWIAWDHMNPATMGNHRLNLDEAAWRSLTVGDSIELLFVGDNPSPQLSDGIFASDGNFTFDLVLLSLEFTGALAFAWPLFRRGASP